jgi:hypothetical protein
MVPYTGLVRHLVAIVVGVAFAATAFQVSTLHTHAYVAHGHPEHDHAPAAHEHPQPVAHHDADDDDAVHLESCDPGQHVVSVTAGCPPPPRVDVFDAPSAHTRSLHPLVLLRSAHSVTDVRVHGPPPRAQASPRAPPLTFPA